MRNGSGPHPFHTHRMDYLWPTTRRSGRDGIVLSGVISTILANYAYTQVASSGIPGVDGL
jgi:hypothetical protein